MTKLQPSISESPGRDLRTKRLIKQSITLGRGGEVTGWGSSKEAKDPWQQRTYILVTWIPHMWALRFTHH